MTATAASSITFKPFTSEHLPGAVRLSQEAGWPHRIEDWALTLSASAGVVALDAGQVIGTALCAQFGTVARMGMIVVDQRARGRGLGRRLMDRIIALADAREMRLLATADGLPLYEKLGFVVTGRVVQHQGIAIPAAPERAVRLADATEMAELARLDLAASGMDRADLLARIATTGRVLRTEGGFALLHRFGRGHVLGPVVARDAASARALMADAATRLQGGFLRIDLPAGLEMGAYAETLGLAPVGEGTAMVRAPRRHPASEFQTYALASHAFG